MALIVAGLSIQPVGDDQISLFGGGVTESDFTVQALDQQPKGKNRVDVDVTVQNTGAASHEADVTVQLLDASGNLLLESTEATGSIAASASTTLSYSFNQAGIVEDYSSVLVVIDQTA